MLFASFGPLLSSFFLFRLLCCQHWAYTPPTNDNRVSQPLFEMASDPLAEAFDLFDMQKDGLIDFNELSKIAEAVESPLTSADIQNMIAMASGGKNVVSAADFKQFMASTAPAFGSADEVIKAFAAVADDAANPGKIRLKVALEMLSNIGDTLTPEELHKFEHDAQGCLVDGTDSVDFVKLAKLWTKPETLESV
jgi:centrin-3